LVLFAAPGNLAASDNGPADDVTPSAGMMRFPDVSSQHIVFSYAGDLWMVSRDGGQALPLASPEGQELMPRFSPDGKTIAFVANYGSGTDLFTIPITGGPAQRITYHPSGELLCDWSPDGALIYSTNGFAGLQRQPQLWLRRLGQPLSEQLPVPYGTNGAISADGAWLAYTPHSHDSRTWKRYRGGMASNVWMVNLNDGSSRQVTDWEGTDSLPMWHGDKLYYISDQGPEHRLNIWMYDPATSERTQVTKFDSYDCKWPSIGPGAAGGGEIVVQNGASLWLVPLDGGEPHAVDITIPGDRPAIRPHVVDASDFIESGDISPSGKRIVLEARGDIWTLPAEHGSPRNLTRTSGVAERTPSWSPDGQWIAYLSDATGEYELYLTQSDGRGETRQLTKNGSAYRYNPTWSPDSKHVAFTDKGGGIWLYTIDGAKLTLVDTDPFANQVNLSWSSDSNWIAYAKSGETRSPTSALWIYNVAEGKASQLTSGFFSDGNPVFDRKGDYLFYTSSRVFTSPRYEDVGTSFVYTGTEVILALPLRADVKNPLLPKSDEESWKGQKGKDDEEKNGDEEKDNGESDDAKQSGDKEDEGDKDSQPQDESKPADQPPAGDEAKAGDKPADEAADKKDEKKDEAPKPVKIELDQIEQRSFQLPISRGNFGNLAVNDKGHLVYVRRGEGGGDDEGPGPGAGGSSIRLFDMEADEPRERTVVDGAGQFGISADGKKLLVSRQGNRFFVIDAAADQRLEDAVSTDGMTVVVDPREEWRQVFTESWRVERDFFYDPNMHGVDWAGTRDHYAAMLEECASRADVGFVISEMISELNVGHAYYRPSDEEGGGGDSDVGLLGCRFELADGAYRIAELYQGGTWDTDARNPLVMAGVKQGEFILAVNNVPISTEVSPYAAFMGTAGNTITLTVSADAQLSDDDRQVIVEALNDDSELRFRAWIERNRQYVQDKTSGRVGYIYVINTGVPGQNDLFRQFYAQMNLDALIIDDRWNGGGQIPTRFIELLNRPVTNYWARRDGRDWTWPPDSHQGPKCMLTNGMAGSGGDMFPALFRQAGLGKLIGMRTWGGLVGISGNPSNIDGSSVTAPTFAFYESDGTWGIEGHGVDPDLEVVDDPAKMRNNGDPQLEAAIALMNSELESNPYQPPARPGYPDRRAFGIAEQDR